MSKLHSPIQYLDLFKSCIIVFAIQALIVILSPWGIVATFRWHILTLNFIVSLIIGWHLYKRFYHPVFSYNDEGFTLKRGRSWEASYKWSDFSNISLIRSERGEFSIRLYRGEDFFNLPVSRLKLDPFQFRSELMEFIKKQRGTS